MTLEEASTAVEVMREAREDAIQELLMNEGPLDDLYTADGAFWHAIDIWGKLDDEAKKVAEPKTEVPNAVEGSGV